MHTLFTLYLTIRQLPGAHLFSAGGVNFLAGVVLLRKSADNVNKLQLNLFSTSKFLRAKRLFFLRF